MRTSPYCHRWSTLGSVTALCISLASVTNLAAQQPGIVSSEFIFDKAAFPQCHASTIAETKQGLVTAWFGGTREKDPDVGIWVSRQVGSKWTPPVEVVNGVQNESLRYPCWNPVLFTAADGKLLLFYKVGPSPSTWWGIYD
jgi:predicted neuraminidase